MSTGPTDESVKNLEQFVEMLIATIQRMSGQVPLLKGWVRGIAQLDTAAEEALKDGDSDHLPGALGEIESCLGEDEEVEWAITACAQLKTVTAAQAALDLDSPCEDLETEAGAFETLADEVHDGLQVVRSHLQTARTTQSHEAGEAVAAMDRLEREATAVFSAVRTAAEGIVSGLGGDLERSGFKALTADATLSPWPDSIGDAVDACHAVIEQVAPVLGRSHDARREALEEVYRELDRGAKATVSSLQQSLRLALEANAAALLASLEALGDGDGVVAEWGASLQDFLAELDAWGPALEALGGETGGLEGLAADLTAAYDITTRVVGVLNAL